jgi:glutathione synthase
MRYVFVMDPMDKILLDKDTTFAFQRAAQSRGHENFHCEPKDVFSRDGKLCAIARRITLTDAAMAGVMSPGLPVKFAEPEEIRLGSAECIFIRKDPPFDATYLYLTLLLERLRGRTVIMNDPRGLREANEKLYTLNFKEFMPETLVSALPDEIFRFLGTQGGQAVIKPLDGAGGAGVMMLRSDDKNARAIVENVTGEGKKYAMVQAYVPAVTKGDKRILLLGGEVLGAINRVPRADDLRSNIHVGGRVEPCDVTASELAMVEKIAPRLRADGLIFVGLDVIGGKLTEVNVTSPTGIQELSRHRGVDMAVNVIEWVETHASRTTIHDADRKT